MVTVIMECGGVVVVRVVVVSCDVVVVVVVWSLSVIYKGFTSRVSWAGQTNI